MTRKEQNKILDDKIESNVNQCKVDRLNAEISAFSSGDLNKYEFLTRRDLKYKPNALDKARFEFSPLGQTFSTGLDKTTQGYQEEGVIKLLKDIRDGLAGGIFKFKNNGESEMSNLDKMFTGKENKWSSKLNKLNNDVKKLDNYIKENNDKKINIEKKLDVAENECNNLLLEYNQLKKELNGTKNELYETKKELDKAGNDINEKTKYTDKLK